MSEAAQMAENWFVTNLPRLRDLYERSDKSHPDNFFTKAIPKLLNSLCQNSIMPIELVLEKLDSIAWEELLKKTLPYVTQRDSRRGHYQMFTSLDEARGWLLLFERGYQDIRFIAEKAGKAPDLFAGYSRFFVANKRPATGGLDPLIES